jgi:hypothetical protein
MSPTLRLLSHRPPQTVRQQTWRMMLLSLSALALFATPTRAGT